MLGTLIEKELKALLLSPKFAAVFAVCSALIVLSIYIGIEDYRMSIAHYEAVNSIISEHLQGQREWRELNTVIQRHPDPMQIFVSGINNDIGRQSEIGGRGVKLKDSNYSENTIFALFRSMDLMFIVQIVLSLFAILFTYDSISGEREAGTLKLGFSNQLPRSKYVIAKVAGSWLGLVIPLLIPLSLGIMLILIFNIPMTTKNWIEFFLFSGISVIYFTFFICLGVLLSSLNRESSGSFLYLLLIWVSLVLIIPRAGVMVAGQLVPVPTAAEISSKLFQKHREFNDQLIKRMQNIELYKAGGTVQTIFNEFNKYRQKTEQDKAMYESILNEDWRNRKTERERLGFLLSRFSPASAFQLAAMDIAGTGIGLKYSYEDQMRGYRNTLIEFSTKKIEEEGLKSLVNIMGGESGPLDLSSMPKFKYIEQDQGCLMESVMIDTGILLFYILAAMAGTFTAFARYDVR